MKEKTSKSVKKTVAFEESGETFSVEIRLENVSPKVSKETILSMLDVMFETIKETIF